MAARVTLGVVMAGCGRIVQGAVAMGETAWQAACVKAGRPQVLHRLPVCWRMSFSVLLVLLTHPHPHPADIETNTLIAQVGTELTAEVNPLEVGLYGAVSLAKGCYIGQETLAKVLR